ncbi:hypothetical protein MMC07_002621 [Pseudocyphellaria aurata]|nr:hypothetical protein [Pseudocyphellaria aurata]
MTGGQLLGLAGGFKHRDDHHTDPHIKDVARVAIQKIQAERNEQLELVKVVSVQTQVVAGMNYKFVLDTATPSQELHTFEATVYGTSCVHLPAAFFSAQQHLLVLSTPHLIHTVVCLACLLQLKQALLALAEPLGGQEPRLSSHKLLPKGEPDLSDALHGLSSQLSSQLSMQNCMQADQQVESASERSQPALLGAYKDVDSSNADVQAAAQFAAEQLSQQSNSLTPLKLLSVLKARTKVAAGMLFDLQLQLSQDNAADQIVQVSMTALASLYASPNKLIKTGTCLVHAFCKRSFILAASCDAADL